ncbi:molybdopterin molybdotransferase [Pseudochrobactrum saccharolyticum]|uniref:Molybdopterin molybdenumtransferase n=1 Tax=Pseudochrobactrum saccharolyticum TaxID=354352 RepID=A0A7W8EPL3_9HYPH|nr:gephyrin-like molybdotransferase Glp [Pseudochrobactrum saccharolyticum]KAB0539223.1 molybdopterin molybdotransferase MoeA [Pseudochrobactrum saccharolyticum]MBB5090748.1 molybdopterin molybdotransferase [Pseudochrobactrum saccharolyticum]
MALLPVDEALRLLLADKMPSGHEQVALHEAGDRVLATSIFASFNQPPFDASAMDGYAIRFADAEQLPVTLKVIGESAAGKGFDGTVRSGEAVRIFTGAPMPAGADTIVIQEDTQQEGNLVTLLRDVDKNRHIRFSGLDFKDGECLLQTGHLLDPASLSLAAASGHAQLQVYKRPKTAILATGNELVPAGTVPAADQIVSSNSYGVAEIVRRNGGTADDLGIVPDDLALIEQSIRNIAASDADILITLGGASVGDHDLVHKALTNCGVELGFYKIAMRPGKPLMFGQLESEGKAPLLVLGLPGNPVSSLVCSYVFLAPLVARLAGKAATTYIASARLAQDMAANGNRRDYARAALTRNSDGELLATPLPVQDSSMLTVITRADALLIREPFAEAAKAGDRCQILMIR